jgi:hypothetical protein
MASNNGGPRLARLDMEPAALAVARGPDRSSGPDQQHWAARQWSPSLPMACRVAANQSWWIRAVGSPTKELATLSLAKELAGTLPAVDQAPQFAGDKLAIVRPADIAAMVEQFLSHTSGELDWLAWITRRKGIARSTGTFSSPEAKTLPGLCKLWLSGDSVAIVRFRDETPTRLAILERTSASTIVGKMYFGPLHDAWSSTDQAFYDIGIRRVEAHYVNRRNAERLSSLAGHVVAGNSVSVDLDLFRESQIEVHA